MESRIVKIETQKVSDGGSIDCFPGKSEELEKLSNEGFRIISAVPIQRSEFLYTASSMSGAEYTEYVLVFLEKE